MVLTADHGAIPLIDLTLGITLGLEFGRTQWATLVEKRNRATSNVLTLIGQRFSLHKFSTQFEGHDQVVCEGESRLRKKPKSYKKPKLTRV